MPLLTTACASHNVLHRRNITPHVPKTRRHLGLYKGVKHSKEETGVNTTAASKGIHTRRQQVRRAFGEAGQPCRPSFRLFTPTPAGQPCLEVNSVHTPHAHTCQQIKLKDATFASSASPATCTDGSEALGQTHHLTGTKRTRVKLCRCQLHVKRLLSKPPIFPNSSNQNSYTSTSCYAHSLQLPQKIFCCVSCLPFLILHLIILLGCLFSDTVKCAFKGHHSLLKLIFIGITLLNGEFPEGPDCAVPRVLRRGAQLPKLRCTNIN